MFRMSCHSLVSNPVFCLSEALTLKRNVGKTAISFVVPRPSNSWTYSIIYIHYIYIIILFCLDNHLCRHCKIPMLDDSRNGWELSWMHPRRPWGWWKLPGDMALRCPGNDERLLLVVWTTGRWFQVFVLPLDWVIFCGHVCNQIPLKQSALNLFRPGFDAYADARIFHCHICWNSVGIGYAANASHRGLGVLGLGAGLDGMWMFS